MKICATTLGETGGDLFSMTLGIGYEKSSILLIGLFFISLCNYVEKIKSENKQTNNFKVFVNDKLINDCYNYFVEISKKTKFLIIKDTILDYKITIRIEQ